MNRTSMPSSFQAIAQPAATWRQRLAALPRDARDTLFLLAVVAWVLMPQAAHTPWWTMVFVAGLLLWRGLLAWRGQPLPGQQIAPDSGEVHRRRCLEALALC